MCLELLACCCPPCAVLFKRGPGIQCCTTLCLTLLGWLPGCIYACMIVSQPDRSGVNVKQTVNVVSPPTSTPQFIINMPEQVQRAQPPYPIVSAPAPYPMPPAPYPMSTAPPAYSA